MIDMPRSENSQTTSTTNCKYCNKPDTPSKTFSWLNIKYVSTDDVFDVIGDISKKTNIPYSFFVPLGSTGKAKICGDIDLAVDSTNPNSTVLLEKLSTILPPDHLYFNSGTGVWSAAIEIPSRSGEMVQVDFMFTDNMKWTEFAYFSDPENSEYKGALRTALLMSVATFIMEDGVDYCQYTSDGLLIMRASRTFDLLCGIRRIYQHRPKKVRGNEYLSKMVTISRDEFRNKIPPNINIDYTDILINDPGVVTRTLFNNETTPEDVRTAEQVIALIKKHFSRATSEEIFKRAAYRVKSISEYINLPPELVV